jgi:hypothetical protein
VKLYTKDELIALIREVFARGWYRSVKETIDTRNDGAVGNTLESLLGIKENNLPIPNAQEWELKGQRKHTSSLITLKHIEPSPRAAKVVPNILLPLYGWKHKQAGTRYPETEMSFRSTTSATAFTNRGFIVVVDRLASKVRFVFDASKANTNDPGIKKWLRSVEKRVGLGPMDPEPYWGFEDLRYAIGSKLRNCFYVVADRKVVEGHEYFLYETLFVLSAYSFDNFLKCIENGDILVDFDARTGHNHGTKVRLKQGRWTALFSNVKRVI